MWIATKYYVKGVQGENDVNKLAVAKMYWEDALKSHKGHRNHVVHEIIRKMKPNTNIVKEMENHIKELDNQIISIKSK